MISPWWKADRGDVNSDLFTYVATVEAEQVEIYDRFLKLDYLYDPESFWARQNEPSGERFKPASVLSENVIASNIDTVASAISPTEVRARFIPDDADWSEQRRARELERYTRGLDRRYDVHPKARKAFKDAAKKGTGIVKVFPDSDAGEVCVERVLVDDIVVDERECRSGPPKQIHHRMVVAKEELIARYPSHEEAITAAHSPASRWHEQWADYRRLEDSDVVVIESWRLPCGKRGRKGHIPGRHTLCIDGYDLFDEPWHKGHFPLAHMVWVERTSGWYGISLAERIAGHQRKLNKRNWQFDRQQDNMAIPVTWVRMADANLTIKTMKRGGALGVYKAEIPKTVHGQAVSPELYQDRVYTKESAYEESGMSMMQATSRKPASLESGAALREYRDQTTQRFSIQEKAYERFVLDILWLCVDAAKDLGDDAPEIVKPSRFGRKRIKWSDVDMGDVRVTMAAANPIAKTPAGRRQFVMELAQAGIVSLDSARRMMRLEDTDRELSLYITDLENLEETFERILDGEKGIVPEPYQNMQMGVWRGQRHYLKAQQDGAPPEILEALRQWIVQAAWIVGQAQQPTNDQMAGVEPGAPAPAGPAPSPAIAAESLGVATA